MLNNSLKSIYNIGSFNFDFSNNMLPIFSKNQENINNISNKVPVIITPAKNSKLKLLEKKKFLVDKEVVLMKLKYFIQKKLNLESNQAMFLFSGNQLVDLNKTIGQIYDSCKGEDEILYLFYREENCFGSYF